MKRKLILLVILVQLCSISVFNQPITVSAAANEDQITTELIRYQENIYADAVKGFKKISIKKLHKLIGSKMIYVFWGRKTCPYCRAFVPSLAKVSQQRHIKIYYVDTTKTDSNLALKKARKHFKIIGVPSLTKIKSYKLFKVMDSTKPDISQFLTKKF